MEIKHPCPMLRSRMAETDNGFYCSACQKEVVDFRNKSIEEVKTILSQGGCGVFYASQLTSQKAYKPIHQFAFRVFMVLSFVGFSVKPLKAQTTDTTKHAKNIPTEVKLEAQHTRTLSHSKIQIHRKRRIRIRLFRRKRRQVMGCPSF